MFKIKELEEFAVIERIEDEISLNDLTIFMGDNSAGKSYLATLIHSFIMSEGYWEYDLFKAITSKFEDSELLKNIKEAVKEVVDNSNSSKNILLTDKEIDELKEIIYFVVDYLLTKYLPNKLFGEKNLKHITVELESLEKNLIKTIVLKSSQDFENITSFTMDILFDNKHNIKSEFQGDFPKDIVCDGTFHNIIVQLIQISIKKSLSIKSIYLPASRTGYLQTYQILANKAIFKTYGDNEDIRPLSDIIRVFIAQLNNFEPKTNENILTDFIEKEILNGQVKLSNEDAGIEFFVKDKKIELNYLSSTISELIPLVVFLKRGFIKKNSLLVIEEPEAHLSFKNQKRIAKLIALLLKHQIKVLITTHSDFLIYEINNLIIQNSINRIKKENVYENTIDHKKVSLYNFLLQDNGKSIVKKVKITNEGINNPYIFENIYSTTQEKNRLLDEWDALNADS
ncbi:MAG: hypothetical protein DSY46_07800 [Hydrogenimonas sp.]|nr:MAG: hypothetical protein DSY46_07800 [Hydrogenimonas sp.]